MMVVDSDLCTDVYSCNVQMTSGSESWRDPSACMGARRQLSPVGSKLGS